MSGDWWVFAAGVAVIVLIWPLLILVSLYGERA